MLRIDQREVNKHRCLLKIIYSNFHSVTTKFQPIFFTKYYNKRQNAANIHFDPSSKSAFHLLKSSRYLAGYELYFDILQKMLESGLMFKRKTISYFVVVIIHFKERI